ncbi:XRE family transcriptional regulator [Microbispora sp. NPDC049125]|uniref:XRE family transcriptional regulator n=1 Tax=Microbispora sp. NPDC049125 TaxID=3154929 RepID=UPI003467723A
MIAQEIRACCGHSPLKSHRLAKGWTIERAVESFHEMCAREGLGARGLTIRSWIEWEGEHLPSADYQDLLCRLFLTGPVQLGFARAYGSAGEPARPPFNQQAVVINVARESLSHAGAAHLSDVSAMSLEHLDGEIRRLASEYVYADPLPLFRTMLQLRDDIFRLLDGHVRPGQAAQLMLFAGQVCGLLANASLDMGDRAAAMTQAKAAWTYASVIDHHPLRAWVRGLQAMISYWNGCAAIAGDLARDGQRYAPSRTAFARLASIEALASAAMGAEAQTLRAVGGAWDRKGDYDEIHDGVGGEFHFDMAKHFYLAAGAYVHLRHADAAITCADQAISLYRAGPPHLRAYGNEAIAYSDLTVGHLLKGDLEAATSVLTNVLALPERQRIDGLAQRLQRVRGWVTAEPRFRGCPHAQALVERIEEFGAFAPGRELAP